MDKKNRGKIIAQLKKQAEKNKEDFLIDQLSKESNDVNNADGQDNYAKEALKKMFEIIDIHLPGESD